MAVVLPKKPHGQAGPTLFLLEAKLFVFVGPGIIWSRVAAWNSKRLRLPGSTYTACCLLGLRGPSQFLFLGSLGLKSTADTGASVARERTLPNGVALHAKHLLDGPSSVTSTLTSTMGLEIRMMVALFVTLSLSVHGPPNRGRLSRRL